MGFEFVRIRSQEAVPNRRRSIFSISLLTKEF